MSLSKSFNLRVALAGSVGSSRRTLQALFRHGIKLVGVLGLSPLKSANVSGYCRLDDLAISANIPYVEFKNVNNPEIIDIIRQWSLDLLFVVGLSQLIKKELLSIPRLGCVGFHPTWLPKGRGRAPVAWLTLEGCPGAATFFLMDDGADSGPILAQEPFFVSEDDYATDVTEKLELAIDAALDRWLPRLLTGEWQPVVQRPDHATFYGKRAPEDALIIWEWSAERIYSLIRAASRPYPGAYTYLGYHRLIIWRAKTETSLPYKGAIGRIVHADNRGWLVQTGDGLLWLTEVEFIHHPGEEKLPNLRVGTKLGYSTQDELNFLLRRLVELEGRLSQLEEVNSRPNRSKK
jgi:methionyl-tRNA formyltransferase